MTISILAFDEKSGTYGGAAATGSLCVGGWVLRGDAESGMSASQGSLPSTLWGTESLSMMKAGASAPETVEALTASDEGRMHRQLAVLDPTGLTASFTGNESIPVASARSAEGVIASGNMLKNASVLDAALHGYLDATGAMSDRLLAALDAAAAAGGDSRGLLSAALLVVSRDMAPLTLRIDKSDAPLADLRALYTSATTGPYAEWAKMVPTVSDPESAIPFVGDVEIV